ncbi:MAG: tyrosine-type recombinase/integrase [Alphaproteobacteria bacterium]|nr:tyrosine-type recombinase/integrase [Alphaproteobacteria bacterium]
MSSRQKLTKRFVESITPHEKDELFFWDSELKGFGLRIFPTGRRTYFVQYRNQLNSTRRKKIGLHGNITADQAREEAKKLLGDVAKGSDPSKDHQQEKLKPIFDKLAAEYMEVYAKANKKPKSYKEDQKMLDSIILKRLGYKKLDEIATHDIQHLHHALRDTPYMANRVRALLSKMFNLAIQWKWASANPVEGVSKYKEQKRDRWLNDQEVQRLFSVLETYHNQSVANAIRLLLLTGSRRGEVLGAMWEQFNLESGVWTKPAHTTKQSKMEHLPLSLQVIDLLKRMKARSISPYLFPGKIPGEPLQDIKKAWKTISTKAEIPNVRLHDLRHTHASHLVSSGLSLSIVGKLLGHTQASTTQRYAHLADAPLRQAAELFGNKVERLTTRSS